MEQKENIPLPDIAVGVGDVFSQEALDHLLKGMPSKYQKVDYLSSDDVVSPERPDEATIDSETESKNEADETPSHIPVYYTVSFANTIRHYAGRKRNLLRTLSDAHNKRLRKIEATLLARPENVPYVVGFIYRDKRTKKGREQISDYFTMQVFSDTQNHVGIWIGMTAEASYIANSVVDVLRELELNPVTFFDWE